MPRRKNLQELLNIDLPILIAPMFLVSNSQMVIAAMQKGAAACIPSLNYKEIRGLRQDIRHIKKHKTKNGAFGFNIIVNKSNLKLEKQLKVCCEEKVDFIITSLGNPDQVIKQAHQHNIKVFCDVVNLEQAQKVENLGCDAVIAVNNLAGGHRGGFSPKDLIKTLIKYTSLPVISAGGINNYSDLNRVLLYGASGVSIGSPFIASEESSVSEEYKQACINYGAKDIVMTKKISGTPCTVINTPYVEKIGLEETWVEKKLNRYKFLKKWVKLLRYIRGTQNVIEAATQATYKNVWVAGPSIEFTKKVEPVSKILDRFLA